MSLSVIVLAAGQGKRMYSTLPKVLHSIAGQPMLAHVLATVQSLQADQCIVVYGHGGKQVRTAFTRHSDLDWVKQAEQLGTGHAVAQALPVLQDAEVVLILYGDVPLITAQTLQPLLDSAAHGSLSLLTALLHDPTGYGRIVRDDFGHVQRIVEQKDATPAQQNIREINTGILAINANQLNKWVNQLNNDNAQGEYYLTDIIAMAVADGIAVEAHRAADPIEIQGINNRSQLAQLERHYQMRLAENLMQQGVTLRDPARIDIRGALTTGQDVCIDVNVVFEGEVSLGDGVQVEPNCIIRNCQIGSGAIIRANTVMEQSVLGNQVEVGPFARLRPNTRLADRAKIGNFVEAKNTYLGEGSKANHLTYLGDTEVGRAANIGAGTITCNYDGANKHKIVIADQAFIGSNTALVAPLTIGEGATVGAGSTLSQDVPAKALVLTRSKVKTIPDWPRPKKVNKK